MKRSIILLGLAVISLGCKKDYVCITTTEGGDPMSFGSVPPVSFTLRGVTKSEVSDYELNGTTTNVFPYYDFDSGLMLSYSIKTVTKCEKK